MISTNATGTAAYAAVQDGLSIDAPTAEHAPDQTSFSSTLNSAISNLTELGQKADAASTDAMMGRGNLTDVVMAVSKAEMALQASVAVRDRMISAYQDIMKMAV